MTKENFTEFCKANKLINITRNVQIFMSVKKMQSIHNLLATKYSIIKTLKHLCKSQVI
jgi:hypothetical protein